MEDEAEGPRPARALALRRSRHPAAPGKLEDVHDAPTLQGVEGSLDGRPRAARRPGERVEGRPDARGVSGEREQNGDLGGASGLGVEDGGLSVAPGGWEAEPSARWFIVGLHVGSFRDRGRELWRATTDLVQRPRGGNPGASFVGRRLTLRRGEPARRTRGRGAPPALLGEPRGHAARRRQRPADGTRRLASGRIRTGPVGGPEVGGGLRKRARRRA